MMDVKDSGKREQFASGMVRDTTDEKVDYTLAIDGPMFRRYAEHLTKGARKYEKRNWMRAAGQAELDRFRESALRHLMQWLAGDRDEDHAAAVWFNVNGAEYVREKMEEAKPARRVPPGVTWVDADKYIGKRPTHASTSPPPTRIPSDNFEGDQRFDDFGAPGDYPRESC